ncbi:MAG: MBL fold metallo-hydrolase [Firmicutes bacterium]|nr:MBL fold metallo-hydrolase [Bacillota bacterium]
MSNCQDTPAPGITWLEPGIGVIKIPVPLPVKVTNSYVLGDPPEAVVDCGPCYPSSLSVLRDSIQGTAPRVCVATHLHVDHYGASGTVQREWGCEVWMGDVDAEEGWRFYAGPRDDDHLYWEAFMRHGVPHDGAEATYGVVQRIRGLIDYPTINRRLADGEEIDLGGRRWRVAVTPGHTTGHVCLYSEREGILLSGDHVLPRITPNIGLSIKEGFNPIQEYLKSLERTAGLNARVAYPGHGAVIDNPTSRVREIIDHHVLRARRVLEIMGPSPLNGYEVALGMWGNTLDAFQMRFAVAEAVAHLDWLAAEGWVVKTAVDGVTVYAAVRPGEAFERGGLDG